MRSEHYRHTHTRTYASTDISDFIICPIPCTWIGQTITDVYNDKTAAGHDYFYVRSSPRDWQRRSHPSSIIAIIRRERHRRYYRACLPPAVSRDRWRHAEVSPEITRRPRTRGESADGDLWWRLTSSIRPRQLRMCNLRPIRLNIDRSSAYLQPGWKPCS